MKPSTTDIKATLDAIEATERGPEHPRRLAREAVARWRSIADVQRLPIVNIVDTGAPLLRADDVLGHESHDKRLGRKV